MKKISKKQKKETNGGSTKIVVQSQTFGYSRLGSDAQHTLGGNFSTGGGNLRVGSVSRN